MLSYYFAYKETFFSFAELVFIVLSLFHTSRNITYISSETHFYENLTQSDIVPVFTQIQKGMWLKKQRKKSKSRDVQ
jgi:hypothetical protein